MKYFKRKFSNSACGILRAKRMLRKQLITYCARAFLSHNMTLEMPSLVVLRNKSRYYYFISCHLRLFSDAYLCAVELALEHIV